jgi:biopolymer transport protein ExbD
MAHADREDAMVIGITRENKLFFGPNRLQPSQLSVKIRASVAHGAEEKVYIKADARAKYAWVAEVVNQVHEAGIEKVGFLVDQRKDQSAAAQ